MKAFYFLIPILMINSCKTQTATTKSSEKAEMIQLKDKTDCPDEGTCTVVVHQNKAFEMTEDGTGATYSNIVDGQNIVVEYTYFKEASEGIADGNYTENIYFEIPASTKNLVKKDAALADVKMFYGKHAYKNSQYYPVINGNLSVQKTGNSLTFNLNFKIDQTSQVVSNINHMMTLE